MHRFINLLYYIIFLPGLFLFGEDRNNIDIFYVDNILSVQTNFFERQFKADNTSALHSFYPISWTDKSTDAELLSGENKDWFKFCLENIVIESKNGGWDYLGYKKRPLDNNGVEVIIKLSCQKEAYPELDGVFLNYYL